MSIPVNTAWLGSGSAGGPVPRPAYLVDLMKSGKAAGDSNRRVVVEGGRSYYADERERTAAACCVRANEAAIASMVLTAAAGSRAIRPLTDRATKPPSSAAVRASPSADGASRR